MSKSTFQITPTLVEIGNDAISLSLKSTSPRIAIIGAGMSGMVCARQLSDSGLSPTVFDKSRGIGGRLATRRVADGMSFDHGAQYVTARGPDFLAMLDRATRTDRADRWRPRGHRTTDRGSRTWIVGTPGMNALVKPLAAGIDVRISTDVSAIDRDADGWRVYTQADPAGELFDVVVATVPAPQARALLAAYPEFHEDPDRVAIAPCWALLVAFEERCDVPFDVRRSETEDLAWIARNSSKARRGDAKDCWVAHASPAWSIEHLELERDSVSAIMVGLDRVPWSGVADGRWPRCPAGPV